MCYLQAIKYETEGAGKKSPNKSYILLYLLKNVTHPAAI